MSVSPRARRAGREPAHRGDDEDDQEQRRLHERSEQHDKEEERDREQCIDDAHHEGVDEAPDVTGERAPHEAEERGDDPDPYSHLEGALSTDHERTELVSPLWRRAEQVMDRRRLVFQKKVRRELVRGVEDRTEPAERHDRRQHDESGDAHPVLSEGGERLSPVSLRARLIRVDRGHGRAEEHLLTRGRPPAGDRAGLHLRRTRGSSQA